MWIDIGKLIREHTPDKNGKTLPADLTSGSYEFRDLTDNGIGSLFEGKVIFDKTYGHVAYGCASCCGYYLPVQLTFDPFDFFFQDTFQNGISAYDYCADTMSAVDGSFYYNWGTGDTTIASVDGYGLHSGIGPGYTSSFTSGLLASQGGRICPLRSHSPSGTARVRKPGFLQVVATSDPNYMVCLSSGCEIDVWYRVLDVNGASLNMAGMKVLETVTLAGGNTCSYSTFDDLGQWTTSPTGNLTTSDNILFCPSTSDQGCVESLNQTFTVNGYPVLLMSQDGGTTGTKNAITITSANGITSCPRIAITP